MTAADPNVIREPLERIVARDSDGTSTTGYLAVWPDDAREWLAALDALERERDEYKQAGAHVQELREQAERDLAETREALRLLVAAIAEDDPIRNEGAFQNAAALAKPGAGSRTVGSERTVDAKPGSASATLASEGGEGT